MKVTRIVHKFQNTFWHVRISQNSEFYRILSFRTPVLFKFRVWILNFQIQNYVNFWSMYYKLSVFHCLIEYWNFFFVKILYFWMFINILLKLYKLVIPLLIEMEFLMFAFSGYHQKFIEILEKLQVILLKWWHSCLHRNL